MSSSRPRERSVYSRDALWRKPLRPTDTNRPDYARAEEGRATSRERACWCALKVQAWVQRRYESMSQTMLTREFQSGRDLSWGPPHLELGASIRAARLHHHFLSF